MRWGVWGAGFDKAQYQKSIEQCLQLGLSTFDHADIYGGFTTELDFGQAINEMDIPREEYQLITKCGIRMPAENRPENYLKSYDTSYEYIQQSVENSLKYLHTDYINVLLIHRPSPLMDVYEIARAFDDLKSSGRVREFGVSNFTIHQFKSLNNLFPLCTNQLEISVMQRNFFEEEVHFYRQQKIFIQAWSPLAGGILFGESQENEAISRLRNLCQKYDWTMAEMAMNFLWHHPSKISPVIGSSNISRIKETLENLRNEINDQQWFEIWTAAQGSKVP